MGWWSSVGCDNHTVSAIISRCKKKCHGPFWALNFFFFLHDKLQGEKNPNPQKICICFFVPCFELKVKTAVFLKPAAVEAAIDFEQ
jgi:hypothetical protein